MAIARVVIWALHNGEQVNPPEKQELLLLFFLFPRRKCLAG